MTPGNPTISDVRPLLVQLMIRSV